MQLHSESNSNLNTVTAYGSDYIEINKTVYKHAVHFRPEGNIESWAVKTIKDINADRLRELAGLGATASDPMAFLDAGSAKQKPDDAPEVILIGTGLKQYFLPPAATRSLLALGIGVEFMSTQAAARTYNILMSEGRRVVAALLPCEEVSS